MESLQKKRDHYRFEIRKQALENMFAQVRKQLVKTQQRQLKANQGVFLQESIIKLSRLLNQCQYSVFLIQLQTFHELQLKNGDDITACFNLFPGLMQFYKKLLENNPMEEETFQEKQIQQGEWQEIPTQFYNPTVRICLLFFGKIDFQHIQFEAHQRFIGMLWPIFGNVSEHSLLDMSSQSNNFITIPQLMVKVLTNSLTHQVPEIFKKYYEAGLNIQLVNLVSQSQHTTNDFKFKLLKLVDLYVKLEAAMKDPKISKNGNYQCGIAIIGVKASISQTFLTFGLYFIDGKYEKYYVEALSIISTVLSYDEYLCSSIPPECLEQISLLILSDNVVVRDHALSLMVDITFYSQCCTEHLMGACFMLDIMHKRLCRSHDQHPGIRKITVQFVSYIICNCLLAKRKHIKQSHAIDQHPIWELIYQSLNPESPFFFLSTVYEYYFLTMPRHTIMKMLQSFCYALAAINLNNSPNKIECQKLKHAVLLLWVEADKFWPERDTQQIHRLLQVYKLNFILEQVGIEQDEQKQHQM